MPVLLQAAADLLCRSAVPNSPPPPFSPPLLTNLSSLFVPTMQNAMAMDQSSAGPSLATASLPPDQIDDGDDRICPAAVHFQGTSADGVSSSQRPPPAGSPVIGPAQHAGLRASWRGGRVLPDAPSAVESFSTVPHPPVALSPFAPPCATARSREPSSHPPWRCNL
ncbi:uncharacterized protein [Triticum aestivum]|uniref:uncharacterized protein isoform X1 n=1 Tax=Triticum aestivum TaxID=4565 RepID=UPI001D026082|nr:uncharacterized protein LOC123138898 isoform X1 [Triticum aestivum]